MKTILFLLLILLVMPVTAQDVPLRQLADERGIIIGTAVQSGLLQGDYAEVLSREFNSNI